MEYRVLVIQRRLPQYRIQLFNMLHERLGQENIDFQIVYGNPAEEEILHDDEGDLFWGIKVSSHYKNIAGQQFVWQSIPREVFSDKDLIIIPHENRFLFNYYLFLWKLTNKGRIAFWGHGANFQSKRDTVKEKIKAWMAKQADWYFAYTSLSADRIAGYGFPRDRITCLNNTIETNSLLKWKETVTPDEIDVLRAELNIKGQQVGIFLGSLTKPKRLDFLFSSSIEVRKQIPDFELVIIGDGPLRDEVKNFQKEYPWLRGVGAKHGREKVLHLCLGKIMLSPGMVGLNIIDSFALGLPMVTTDCGTHSPEIAYLKNGKNGFMTTDNQNDYVKCIVELFKNQKMYQEIRTQCMKDMTYYSLENMVENFMSGITRALKS